MRYFYITRFLKNLAVVIIRNLYAFHISHEKKTIIKRQSIFYDLNN